MRQARLFISGYVHGVGYRQFMKRSAEHHSVVGWVKNLPDGRVEAVMQGSKENIQQVINSCRKGPFLAEVENVEVVWEETKESHSSFDILHG